MSWVTRMEQNLAILKASWGRVSSCIRRADSICVIAEPSHRVTSDNLLPVITGEAAKKKTQKEGIFWSDRVAFPRRYHPVQVPWVFSQSRGKRDTPSDKGEYRTNNPSGRSDRPLE